MSIPTVEDVLRDPTTAPVVDVVRLYASAWQLILAVDEVDSGAAWVYLDRFPEHFVDAMDRRMVRIWRGHTTWTAPGRSAMIRHVARAANAQRKRKRDAEHPEPEPLFSAEELRRQ